MRTERPRTHPLFRACLPLGLVLLLAGAAQAQPQATLSVPLAEGPDAAGACGTATGVSHHGGATRGHWPVRVEQDGISWLAEGNLDKARGTIAFHFRAGWKPGGPESYALVCDDREFAVKADNALRLWKWENRCLRFDCRSAEDRYVTAPLALVEDGEWHHLAAAWDRETGIRLYIDGKRVGEREFAFTPVPAKWLNLGHGQGIGPGIGDYRGLVVLDRMIDDQQAAVLAAGKLQCPAAPKRARQPAAAPAQAPVGPAKVVFRLGFEGTLDAEVAAAGKQPRKAQGVRFVDSPFGRAAYFGEGSLLEYPGEANVPHERGTLAMWVRPDWDADSAGGSRFFFREGPPDSAGDDCRWVWFWKDSHSLRFDLRTPGDPYVNARIGSWRPGTWHHLALTWDAELGTSTVIVDGRALASRSDSKKSFLRRPWEAKSKTHFWVGSQEGRLPALAAIDELVIYDRPLAPEAVLREVARVMPLAVSIDRPYPDAGARSVALSVTNRSTETIGGPFQARVTGPDGASQSVALPGARFAPGETRALSLPLSRPAAGSYTVEVAPEGKQPGPAATFRLCALNPPPAARPTERLLAAIDLTAQLPEDCFCDTGDSRVVESPLGRYREAGAKKGSRFAVRLRFEKPGAWHRVEWSWPDDKPRSVDVILNRGEYDVASGTLAGDEYPNTGEMRTQSFYCWPRAEDDALVFMTAEPDRPAAAAAVKVFELSGPPASVAGPKPRFQGAGPRQVGLYYEDPVLHMNFGGRPAFPSFEAVADRLVAYLEAHGMNTLYYPAVWYHGPLYPSPSQGDDQLGSRPHPDDFLAYLLRRFEGRALKLLVTFNVHDLPTLSDVEVDEERVRAGAQTPITVLWNSALKLTGWHGTPGDYNPIDPAVHAAVRGLVEEIAGRYAGSPAFGGICLHLPRHSLLWFGQLEGGYNDVNLRAFQKETGIDLGIDWADPLRANRAYRRLIAEYRERWLDWRCGRIARQWGEYAGILRKARPDLALAVNLYTVLDESTRQSPETPPEAVDYLGEARAYGADVRLLARIPNVALMNTFSPGLYRWHRSRRAPFHPGQQVFRTACFSPSAYGPFAGLGAPFGVNLHDKYWEDDIARNAGLPGLKAWGQPELGWRVSTPVPPAPDCLENYAEALGQVDARTVTKGGFVVGTVGMEEAVAGWAAAFRQLPAVPFRDVPGLEDPVRVRVCSRPDGEWAYAQNRLAQPVDLVLRVAGNAPLANLATGGSIAVREGVVRLRLEGYGLASLWAPAGATRVTGGQAQAPEAAKRLQAKLSGLREALAKADAQTQKQAKPRCDLAADLISRGHFSRATHVLEEPWAAALSPR